ncbi:MAG TPA: discoidin domain-containing protein [Vicinamibacteria bacterium]|nr:discoidin domain-containing protein [Vicinamibacteria bacterium]
MASLAAFGRRLRTGRGAAVAASLYVALVFASFYPQSVHPRDTIAYVGDSLESVSIVAWNVHQFFRSPFRLFDANWLHPHERALAFTDHRLLPSLAVAPVVWATSNPVLATNVAVGLVCLLAAMGGRRLGQVLGLPPVAAWAAGALYAFHTYQVNEAPRLNIVSHGFIAFALAELVLYLTTGERRRAWRTAGFMLLQGLSSHYHLLYGVLLVGLIVAGAVVARPRVVGPRLPRLGVAALVAAVLFLPFVVPYVRAARDHGFVRELGPGIDLQHYVSTSPTNLIYGAIGTEVRLQQRGPHFVGFVSLGLALAAVVDWVRRRGGAVGESGAVPASRWVPVAAALALVLVVLSLGPDVSVAGRRLGPGPYRLLYDWVPGFQLVRIPERLGLLAMLFVGLLAGRTLSLIEGTGERGLGLLLAALVPLEHVGPLPLSQRVPVGRHLPEVVRWLAEDTAQAVAEVPIHGEGLVREETMEMYLSSHHHRPIIHGYTAYPPLLSKVLRRAAAEFPSETSLQVFARLGIDTVVVHHGRPVGGDLARRLRDTGQSDPRVFQRLLRRAELDLYDRLPAAVAAGRLHRQRRFDGPPARLLESTADEVYRLAPVAELPPALFPVGRRRRDPQWRYRAKLGDPALAADGDPSTSWQVPRFLLGDEFFEITFDRPLRVSGVVLPLRRDSAFPTRFRVAGRPPGGKWVELARLDTGHVLELVDRLAEHPRRAALGFDLGGRTLTGISLLVDEAGTSFEGWSLPEVEVWVPE